MKDEEEEKLKGKKDMRKKEIEEWKEANKALQLESSEAIMALYKTNDDLL